MSDYEIITIGPVSLSYDPAFDPAAVVDGHADAIEAVWRDAQAKRGGKLYNDQVLSFVETRARSDGSMEVVGQFFEYKHFLAQRSNHGPDLGIRPVAVSGLWLITRKNEQCAIFGRRSRDNTQYPGLWELVPSGGIDRDHAKPDGTIDCTGKIRDEFCEETKLPRECVDSVEPFTFIYDHHEQVYNVGCRMSVCGMDAEAKDLHKDISSRISQEYGGRVVFPPIASLDDFLTKHAGRIIPPSLGMIEAWHEWSRAQPPDA